MDKDAHKVFKKYHDELKQRKLTIMHDDNWRGIIAKEIGQMACVCMIVHVLDNALKIAQWQHDTDEHDDTQAQVSSSFTVFFRKGTTS